MSSHCMYWGSGSAMSADLKATVRRVRNVHPEYFAGTKVKETSMDGDGKVTTIERSDTRAQPMSGGRRHAMAMTHGKS